MNLKLLNETIECKQIPLSDISEKMGVSRESLNLKLAGKRRFKASEADHISDILKLTTCERNQIFFD